MLMLQSVVESATSWEETNNIPRSPESKQSAPPVGPSASHDTLDSEDDSYDSDTLELFETQINEDRPFDEWSVAEGGGNHNIVGAEPLDQPKEAPEPSALAAARGIALAAAAGTVLRIFVGRLGGLDCDSGMSNTDWFATVAQHVCITSSGKHQRGGALFIDLPANLLGAFGMGLLTTNASRRRQQQSSSRRRKRRRPQSKDDDKHHINDDHDDDDDSKGILPMAHIPWLAPNHPLQSHTALHAALLTGLCGCLTTFASWNTQMVVMMDGTATDFGPQVGSALFGYLLGTIAATASFASGRKWHEWFRARQQKKHESAPTTSTTSSHTSTAASKTPVRTGEAVVLVVSFVAFSLILMGDAVWENLFYRKVWMSILLTPVGALLRWKCSLLNNNTIAWKRWQWMPWGTLLVNIVAALLSIAAEAYQQQQTLDTTNSTDRWTRPLLQAVETGLAGSLSTVATWVRELDGLPPHRSLVYILVTILPSMLLGLLVYSPWVRAREF